MTFYQLVVALGRDAHKRQSLCGLTVLEWAAERLSNSERIAAMKTGADRVSWLEDVHYWKAIVAQLKERDALKLRLAELYSLAEGSQP